MIAVDVRPQPAFPKIPSSGLESTGTVSPALVAPSPRPAQSAARALDALPKDVVAAEAGPSKPSPPRRPPSRTERRFACTFEGCDKAYFKPSRLAEHTLTHTGERPHQCPHCDQSYLRASHLKAHLRTHLSAEERPFECTKEGCNKRFWTATHLKRHEKLHEETPSHECETCGERFHKARHLRDHRVIEHMPPGTKGYPCSHGRCEKSFALHHQLKAHLKTHDPTRYSCGHPDHIDDTPTFPTWSSFQAHLHEAHPPTCPHEECHGRTFKNHQRLKDHLKVHQDQAEDQAQIQEEAITTGDEDDLEASVKESRRAKKRRLSRSDVERPGKLQRLIGGDAGKVFGCEEPGCEKKFKSGFALQTHVQAKHNGERRYKCPHEGCELAYPHLSNLQRHIAKRHLNTPPADMEEAAEDGRAALTGEAYVQREHACPASALDSRRSLQQLGMDFEPCQERFGRLYDLRRHLAAVHELSVDDDQVRQLLSTARSTIIT